MVEDFNFWDEAAWIARAHDLGRGRFEIGNVEFDAALGDNGGALVLTLPANSFNGAEIRSASPVRFRDVEIRLKTPNAPETISAFFLYQLVQRPRNDEIDIEILNGTRHILFTTWVGGIKTNQAERTLKFDPWKDFHDYRIEWSPSRVRFLVKENIAQEWDLMVEFTTGIPRQAMYVMSNTWWPDWLPDCPEDRGCVPDQLDSPEKHIIDRIKY